MDVDFWTLEWKELELMHSQKMYPPRFMIEVSGEAAVQASHVDVSFTGVDDGYLSDVNTCIPLPLPQQPFLNGGISL